jgi:chromosome segregation ATPase
LLIAALLAVASGAFKQGKGLQGEVQSKLDEMETIKQDLDRVRQRAEAMQHERDAALVKARQEQEQRELEIKQALEAAQREKEAAAAALAAEKARQAEELVKKQRIEEARLRAERRRLQQARKEAELVEQRLLDQRRQAELEKQRLESERARVEALASQPVADQQKQPPAGADAVDGSVAGTVTDVAQPEVQKKETSFNTDPCSSPSARFLSTCK